MRHSVAGVLTLLSLAPLMIGCQQTSLTGQSSLTPVSSTGALAPIRATSGVGPLGGSLRVPPPPTGGFAVPNNYMGGATASSQLGASVSNGFGASAGAGFASNQAVGQSAAQSNGQFGASSVQPSGWVQSGSGQMPSQISGQMSSVMPASASFNGAIGSGLGAQPSFAAPLPNQPLQANVQRPQSGGMRVIDLTRAPSPPGYMPTQFGSNQNQFQNQYAGGGMNYNGPLAPQVASQNQFQGQLPGQPQGQFNSQVGFQSRGQLGQQFGPSVVTAVPQNSFRPATQPAATIAAAPVTNNALPRINPLLSSQVQTREFPMQESPLAATWNGVSNFNNKPPSTEPVDSKFGQPGDDLPWRRPDLQ